MFVDETGLVAAALEGDILAHVELAAVEVELAQRAHQRVDEKRPMLARHGEGADVDVRGTFLRLCIAVRPAASVVVAVDVQEDEAVVLGGYAVEELFELPIIFGVQFE